MTDKIALAEFYHSIKGEGLWTGTPMTFVRLAGCSVGKPMQEPFAKEQPELAVLYSGQQNPQGIPITKFNKPAWMCRTYDGRPFWCDTDFNKQLEMTVNEIFDQVYEGRICLTGGEPLMHEEWVEQILNEAHRRGVFVHIETSGTIFLQKQAHTWIAVSPKILYLSIMLLKADEIKLLVDENFDINHVPEEVYDHPLVWLQPINNELGIRRDCLQKCLEILKECPDWRLSPQVHKLIGVR